MAGTNRPEKIVIHCSATPDQGNRYGAKEIKKWHLERGWNDIGYHYVIRRTGQTEIGRPEDVVGAHVRGHNQNSLGICLVGTKRFNEMQWDALLKLIWAIKTRHQIKRWDIVGHYELNDKKDCPGVDMILLRKWLESNGI